MDRESAYEKLTARAAQAEQKAPEEKAAGEGKAPAPRSEGGAHRTEREKEPASVVEQVVGSGMFKSLARSVGTQIGREITRSLFGTARRRRR
ncbi:hypothetical protein GCM10020256_39330 [Streptomyces thermocoprophilus]